MVRRHRMCAIVSVIAIVIVTGCTSSKLHVLRSAHPNPFIEQQNFAVLPIQFVDLQVDRVSEKQFLSGKSVKQVESWEADKAAINTTFASVLETKASDGNLRVSAANRDARFRIQPSIHTIETGYYRIPAWNAITEISMKIQIQGGSGEVIDEFLLTERCRVGYVIGNNLRVVAEILGNKVAEYLKLRVKNSGD